MMADQMPLMSWYIDIPAHHLQDLMVSFYKTKVILTEQKVNNYKGKDIGGQGGLKALHFTSTGAELPRIYYNINMYVSCNMTRHTNTSRVYS